MDVGLEHPDSREEGGLEGHVLLRQIEGRHEASEPSIWLCRGDVVTGLRGSDGWRGERLAGLLVGVRGGRGCGREGRCGNRSDWGEGKRFRLGVLSSEGSGLLVVDRSDGG